MHIAVSCKINILLSFYFVFCMLFVGLKRAKLSQTSLCVCKFFIGLKRVKSSRTLLFSYSTCCQTSQLKLGLMWGNTFMNWAERLVKIHSKWSRFICVWFIKLWVKPRCAEFFDGSTKFIFTSYLKIDVNDIF